METYWYDLHEAYVHAEAMRTPRRNVTRAIHGRRACSRLWGGEMRVGTIDTGNNEGSGPFPRLCFQDGTWMWLDLTIRMVMEEENLDAQLVADALAVRPAQTAVELARSTHLGASVVTGALGRLHMRGAVQVAERRWTSTGSDQARLAPEGSEPPDGDARGVLVDGVALQPRAVHIAS